MFNTEAHPLPVYEWSEWEMEWFNLTRPFDDGEDKPESSSSTPSPTKTPETSESVPRPGPPPDWIGGTHGSGKAPIGGNMRPDWEAEQDHGSLDLDVDFEEIETMVGKGHPGPQVAA